MRFRLGEKYSGVCERRIQHVLDRSRRYQILKARFNNKNQNQNQNQNQNHFIRSYYRPRRPLRRPYLVAVAEVVLHSLRAKEVHTRHQCDLVDLWKWSVQDKGRTYRYIPSIMDVFSRFVWSRPISCKTVATVANHLSSLCLEIGCPKVLQHDRGKEFAGAVDIQHPMETVSLKPWLTNSEESAYTDR